MLSLRETARRHDIDPGYLSTRVRARKPAKGYDLYQYARFSEEGQIEGFVFPPDYVFPSEETQSHEDASSEGALNDEDEDRAISGEPEGEETGSGQPAMSRRQSGARDKDSLSLRPANHGLGGDASTPKDTRPDATADEFFAAANELDMPARSDWITEDEVRSLMVQHLPLTKREWKVLIRPVLERLSKEAVGDRYRRGRIESMIRLIGEHGTERAMDFVITACDLDRERIQRSRRYREPYLDPDELLRPDDHKST